MNREYEYIDGGMVSEYLGNGMVRLGTGEIVPMLRQHTPQDFHRMFIADPTISRLEVQRDLLHARIDDLERHRRVLAWLLVFSLAALAGCVSGILS